jgi:hypothetical protein
MYGLVLYVLSFRNIQAAQFEMALQPEKILLFFLIAEAGQFLWDKYQGRKIIFYLFAFIVIGSSLGYSLQRYDHRFPAFQVMMGKNVELPQGRMASLPMLRGLSLPQDQAREFEAVNAFVQGHVKQGQKVVFYDELGIYHALIGRPFVDRFPTVIFTWLDDRWHKAYMAALLKDFPEYIFVAHQKPAWFEGIYFKHQANKEKFDEFNRFLDSHYSKAETLGGLDVYRNKGSL